MTRPRSRRLAVVAAAAGLALAGGAGACGRRAVPAAGAAADSAARRESTPSPWPEHVVLEVENRYRADVVITIVGASGQQLRLGTVTASGRQALRFPSRLAQGSQQLRLVADPVGLPSAYRSEIFTVQRGQRVVWTLESALSRSMVAVF